MNDDIILIADKRGNPIGGIRANRQTLQANARTILRDRLSLGTHGTSHQGARDYYEILGYKREPDYEDYRAKFERDPMAGAIVEFPCSETWRDTPTVKDGEDKEAKDDTEFAKAWAKFAKHKRIYHYCQRVDTLAGIGQFGVLHIGVSGSAPLDTEVKKVGRLEDVIYLRPYSQEAVTVHQWQTDPNSPRYGLPHIYKINVSHMDTVTTGVIGTKELMVHHSRCIHVAEGLLENEVYGRPRLQRVINLLDDILKVVGGSAEATWKLMRKGFVLNLEPEARVEDGDLDDLEEQIDEYDHELRRYLKTKGMTVTDLGSETVDPGGLFDAIVTLISAATRIPKRILLGSERGELASSQDAANWAGFIASRQLNYAEPMILRPFIDRLINWGALPMPDSGEYTTVWDPLFELTDTEKANNMKTAAQAIQAMSLSVGHPVVGAEEWRGEYTPFADKLPKELEARRDQALSPRMPEDGEDVLDQVARVVGNHGYNNAQGQALIVAAKRVIAMQGA